MSRAKAIGKPAMLYTTGIILLVALSCSHATAEPIEPVPTKEAINKLINEVSASKPDTGLVNTLLTIAYYYLSNEDKKCAVYTDDAFTLAQKLSFIKGSIKCLCLQAAFQASIARKTALATEIIEKAILLCRKEKNPELEAFAYYVKGNWMTGDSVTLSEEYFTESKLLYHEGGNKIKEAYLLKCIADIHLYQNKLKQSLQELLEALALNKEAGNPNLHYTYDLIGTVYRLMGNYDEALKYSLRTLKSAEETNDTTDIALFYRRVGEVFKELNQPAEAIQYFEMVLKKLVTDEGPSSHFRFAAANITILLTQFGKAEEALQFYQKTISLHPVEYGSADYCMDSRTLGDVYFSLKQYNKAEKYYLQMFTLNEKTYNNDYFNLASFISISNFYIAQSKFDKAKEYINKALGQQTLKSLADMAAIHWLQFKIDSASANYLSAIKHYDLYKSLNDSIFNEKKSNQIASINIQFETEKKEQQIGSLTFKNNEQQVVLTQQAFERNVFLAGAIMLLLLLWLSINRYRIKQKANRQLQAQQETINKKNETLNSLLEEKEELLQSKDKLITDKEWLIKEVHHRVKNNLQMVCTLLYTQASYLKDDRALAAINEGQQRIHAISLIHQKLYQSDNLQLVNMKSYVHELVDYLKESFDISREIEFNLQVDSFDMDISMSIPIGLILNEAITNSLKYAFHNGKKKMISIQLQRKENHNILLVIKDNGKGLLHNFDPLQSNSLGISMMQGLSKQINADFSIKNENGTIIRAEFKETNES